MKNGPEILKKTLEIRMKIPGGRSGKKEII